MAAVAVAVALVVVVVDIALELECNSVVTAFTLGPRFRGMGVVVVVVVVEARIVSFFLGGRPLGLFFPASAAPFFCFFFDVVVVVGMAAFTPTCSDAPSVFVFVFVFDFFVVVVDTGGTFFL
eukprot:CAMPEP_0170808700 /NCGR_PEP_ID=MMETSP0733-20121128/33576_1 /TAXON_ID=186038 /ORGANISM="Fragilariopsis kerguelensis, Strain L26-C5" /LENGTH=121 /DNA_ID=CAMNT_0011164231 /DNA_START=30 /DNA_END=392 /DNA_ORIENTATION=-